MQGTRSAFLSGLLADGPVAGRRDAMMLYGWLVGSWQATRIDHLSDGSTHEEDAEIHANWILEGRAVQDVWISPRPGRGNPGETPANGVHGTTLRIYDPSADNWRIVWAHPSTGSQGRRVHGKARAPDALEFHRDRSRCLSLAGRTGDCAGRLAHAPRIPGPAIGVTAGRRS